MNPMNWMPQSMDARTANFENRARIVRLTIDRGHGAECAYCHKRIGAEEPDYEVEAFVLAGLRTLHFHRACHHLWTRN